MKVHSLEKLPKRKVTVDEILHTDNIAEILHDLFEQRHEIDQFILIYTDKDSVTHNYWEGTKERIIFALESAKLRILNGEDQ